MAVTDYYTVDARIIGEATSSARTDYLADALGSVTATVDSSANVVNTYRYKPYGARLSKSGAGADPKFQWVGAYGYRNTGLTASDHYVRARHHGSSSGAWTTVDSMWPGEMPFSYAAANPASNTDPSGLYTRQSVSCPRCGSTFLVLAGKDDTRAIIAGRPTEGTPVTPLVSGKQCLEIAEELFPGTKCICINGGFFFGQNPMGKLNPRNSGPVNGIRSPSDGRTDREDKIIYAECDYVTGVVGIPPSPGAKNSPGRTAACVNEAGQIKAMVAARGCAAKDFEKCAELLCRPAGWTLVWLDGGGSTQIWEDGFGKVLAGNSSGTGQPDNRSVDNWVVMCQRQR